MTGKHARSVPNGCHRSFCTYEGLTLRAPSNLESRRPTSNVAHMLIVRAGTGDKDRKGRIAQVSGMLPCLLQADGRRFSARFGRVGLVPRNGW